MNEYFKKIGFKLHKDLFKKDNITLQLHNGNRVTIKYYDDYNEEYRTLVEQITIENIEELNTLLKQLKIIK